MDQIEKILLVIDILDNDKDQLLIGLLNSKIYEINQRELYKVLINDTDYYNAVKGINKTLNCFYREIEPESSKKAKKILKNNSCEKCKYSIKTAVNKFNKIYHYYDCDKTNSICGSCIIRCDMLDTFICKKEYEYILNYKNLLKNEEFIDLIKCRIILNKLNIKLKQKTK